jgi:protein gp37
VILSPYLNDIQWVIVGGESGPKARPIKPDWVRQIRDDCLAADVPFFFKQWGGRTSKAGGRVLDGCIWKEAPSVVTLNTSKQTTMSCFRELIGSDD